MAKVTWRTASADDPIYKEGLQTSSRGYSREYAKSKATDPTLQELRAQGIKPTQESYLALAHPEGMDAEGEAMLPEEFHSLPKK